MTSYAGLARMARPHAGTLVFSMLVMALHALTTGAYAYLVGPILKFIYSGGGSAGSRLAWVADRLASLNQGEGVGLTAALALVVIALVAFKGVAYFGGTYLMLLTGQRIENDLRVRLHEHLMRVSYAELAGLRRGDLVTRFTSDPAMVAFAVTHGLAVVARDGLQVVVLAVVALWLDPVLGIVALAILPLSAAVIVKVGQRLRARRRKAADTAGALASAVEESVGALPVLRAYGAQRPAHERFTQLSRDTLRRTLQAWGLQVFASPLMELLGAVALAATLWYAGARIHSGLLAPEEFVSFFAAIFMLYRPIKSLGDGSGMLHQGLASLDRIGAILALPSEPEDSSAALDLEDLEESIRFDRVCFSYGGEPVLREASFEIRKGETVALVGPSGAGKTTIALLLLRLVEPSSGTITIDGRDIRGITRASLRRLFAVVTQEPVLINDSVGANIALGLSLEPERIRTAARVAGADRFVSAMPDGYDSSVGEAGARLSGGERQRLCIARAVLRDPKALVLDEATAAVDSATEAEIAAALEDLMAGRTTLLIAHRLSTVRRADRVVVIDGGRVVAQGSLESLASESDDFRRIFCDQLAGLSAAKEG